MKNDKYYSYFDLNDENNSHSIAVNMIGKNKRVLEIGCSTGFVSKVLVERECIVTGIEINQEDCKKAEQYCDKVYCIDVDSNEFIQVLAQQKFDVIYMGDIIEHLKEPDNLLKNIYSLLRDNGYIVASIPNIAHGSIRLKMLDGEFKYTTTGLLDSTHLRFFTKYNIEKMFQDNNYVITKYQNTYLDFQSTEIPIDISKYGQGITEYIANDPESFVYQYIFKAYKDTQDSQIKKVIEQNRLLTKKLEGITKDTENKIENYEKELERLTELVKSKDYEIEIYEEKIKNTLSLLDDKETIIGNLTAKLEAISKSLWYKLSSLKLGRN